MLLFIWAAATMVVLSSCEPASWLTLVLAAAIVLIALHHSQFFSLLLCVPFCSTWKCCHRDPAVPHFWLPLDSVVPSLLVLLPSPVSAYWSRVRSTQGEPVDRLQVTNELDLLQQPHFGLDVLSGSLELLSLHQASADFFPTGECSPLPLASSGSVMC